MYEPRPIQTEHISLPKEIDRLTEKLAENAHDHWAAGRIKEGWRYGEQRNDQAREHPCLVPYDELPESEKQYDRAIAMETLKAIYALGYRVVSANDEN